jgi:hypothetical protein
MAEIIAHHTKQTFEQVEKDIDRDRFMTAEESKSYGIIDEVISSRAIAEGNLSLVPGEPARLAEKKADEDGAPVEKPE